jgi:hypothetical protein
MISVLLVVPPTRLNNVQTSAMCRSYTHRNSHSGHLVRLYLRRRHLRVVLMTKTKRRMPPTSDPKKVKHPCSLSSIHPSLHPSIVTQAITRTYASTHTDANITQTHKPSVISQTACHTRLTIFLPSTAIATIRTIRTLHAHYCYYHFHHHYLDRTNRSCDDVYTCTSANSSA